MKRTLQLFIFALMICVNGLVFASSRNQIVAQGPDVKQTRKVAAFDELEINNVIDATYSVGPERKIIVIAPKSIINYVKTDVRGGKLVCYLDSDNNNGFNLDKRKIIVNVTAPEVNGFDLSGASSLVLNSDITCTGNVEIELSGASKMKAGTLNSSKVEIDISGAAHITVDRVVANRFEIEASGATKSVIGGKVGFADIDVSGTVCLNLKSMHIGDGAIDASGASKVTLKNGAKISSIEKSGSASIK